MRKPPIFLFCFGLMLLILFQVIYPNFAQTTSRQNSINNIDANIDRLRKGDLIIRVVDSQRRPILGAMVKLEQVKHDFEFGTALSTDIFTNKFNQQDTEKYLATAKKLYNASVHENALKWYSTEREKGQVSYTDADKILKWSQKNGLKMRGHTLFWEVEKYNKSWLKNLPPQELRAAVEQRTKEVCSRYKGSIDEHDVLNEMLHGNFFRSRLGAGIVKDMFTWCKQVNPGAMLYMNDYNILNGKELDKYVQLIDSLLKQGVPIDGIGAQGHIRENITAERIQKSLDTLAQFGLPIKITEFDAVADTEREKARILRDVYRVAFAHPAVKGIFMWGFWEGAHWEPKAALFKKNWQPLIAAQTFEDLVYGQWWTRVNTSTGRNGRVQVRSFFGNYHLTVSYRHQKIEQNFSFTPKEVKPKVIDIVITNAIYFEGLVLT